MPPPITIYPGTAYTLPYQSNMRSGRPAAYQAGDVLATTVILSGATTPLFTPDVAWNIVGGLQTGYDQGQTVTTITNDQVGLMAPGKSYELIVSRTLGSNPSLSEKIVRVQLNVVPVA